MSEDQKTPPEPFSRKAVTWGRMPATTFHVGPVPVAPNPLDRIPNPPPRKPTPQQQQASIHTQSLASGVAPAKGQATVPSQAPAQPRPPRPQTGSILGGSLIPMARPASTAPQPATQPLPAPEADLTVRPLPAPQTAPQPEFKSAEAPVVARQPAVEAPVLAPPVTPSFARTPAKSSRLPLYVGVGVAALLVVGGGVWFAMRPAAAPVPATTAAPAAPLTTPPPDTVPAGAAPVVATEAPAITASAPAPAETTPAPAARAATPTAQPRPATVAPRTQTPAATTSQPAASTPSSTPTPTVQTEPLVIVPPTSAPTAARPAASDPSAPVVTRPQPLD